MKMRIVSALAAAGILFAPAARAAGLMETYIGEVFALPYYGSPWCPTGTMVAAGQTLKIQEHEVLFSLLGNRFGGDGKITFRLPDLSNAEPIARDKNNPRFAEHLTWCIQMDRGGYYPRRP